MFTAMNVKKALDISSGNDAADRAALNVRAFLLVIRQAEGTAGASGYNTVFGGGLISDLSDHPAITGEWKGARLSDSMCINAGFRPGCKSTAAGAYQFTKGTWVEMKLRISGLNSFSPENQDKAATHKINLLGALEDVKRGNFETAVQKCSGTWASLPGNNYKQNAKNIATLKNWYVKNGGQIA